MAEPLAFDGADISNAEYQMTQEQVFLLGGLVDRLPLETFLQRLEEADSLGWFLDPTLYMRAGHKINAVRDVARAARAFQIAFRKARKSQ